MSENTPAEKAENEVGMPDWSKYQGLGRENQTSDDYAIPFLSILESNSAAVDDIADAKKGMIWNNATNEVWDAEGSEAPGVVFQPVYTEHCYIEWVPVDDGGGFVARHELGSDVVAQAKKVCKEKRRDFNDLRWGDNEGHELVETYLMYGNVLTEDGEDVNCQAIVSFASTRIKAYKKANSLMSLKGNPPLFCFRLRIKTAPRNRGKQNWFVFDVEPFSSSIKESIVTPEHPVFQAGFKFYGQLSSGALKADMASAGKDREQAASRKDTEEDLSDDGSLDGAETPF